MSHSRIELAKLELAKSIVMELEQKKHLHDWKSEEVIKFIASKMKHFDDNFVIDIFNKCDLSIHDVQSTLSGLKLEGWLDTKSEGFTLVLYTPRKKQEEYSSWMKEQENIEPEPEVVEISESLTDLESQIANSEERVFYEETRLCLKAKAYRAAIVMGWNLIYDHLIRWVYFDQKNLNDFNKDLITRWINKRKNQKYTPIVDLDDFGNIKESMVVDVCHKSKLIDKHDFEALDSGLKKRNKFAHPNSTQTADGPIASGHVSELVNLMLRLK